MAKPPLRNMDVAQHTDILQKAADWGRANGVVSPSLIDYSSLSDTVWNYETHATGPTYMENAALNFGALHFNPDALLAVQKGFHDHVFTMPQGHRTFNPQHNFSAEENDAMRRAQKSLVQSSRWKRG